MTNEFKTIRCAKGTYSFAVQGGAIADATGIGLVIPKGAIVTSVVGNVVSAFTSDGAATVAINIGATEVNAATAYNHADYTAADTHFSTATAITADSEVNLDIAVAALTGGVYDIYVTYLV